MGCSPLIIRFNEVGKVYYSNTSNGSCSSC
uniref:Uncharacterized protein n=1 Tax=Siphoviridae sp. ctnpt50 TaxID=2827941 RepID=A0A8S5SDR4_9CAUD|nr:MAG TPA: hypothetical protein [Siphoviridae sp. ctnpt50]